MTDKPYPAIYRDGNLFVTPFEREMLEKPYYKQWWHDQEVTQYNSHGLFPYTQERLAQLFTPVLPSGICSDVIWAVHVETGKASDETAHAKHIGNVGLQSINWLNRSGELTFMFGDKREWGKGYATRAGKLMIDHAFAKLGLHRIYTGTLESNIGMQKVAGKFGMKQEGILKDASYNNGQFENIVLFGLLKQDWK